MPNVAAVETPVSEIERLGNHLESAIYHLMDSVSALSGKLHPILTPPMLRPTLPAPEGVKTSECLNSPVVECLKRHLRAVETIQEQVNDINTRLEV